MKLFYHNKENNLRLLLLFNGWGFDHKIFQSIDVPQYDVCSVYDYTEIEPALFAFTETYLEVTIAAWSYGVFIADLCSDALANVTKAIAINGSRNPIDDEKGIPRDIFLATMQSFNAATREKFYLRTVGGRSAYLIISERLPDREVDDQLAELKSLYRLSQIERRTKGLKWDIAVVSTRDKIFPFTNLINEWGDGIVVVEGEHYPDFDCCLKMILTIKNT
jgi:hypothetical protein